MSNQRIITIGSRGTSVPYVGSSLVRGKINFGTNHARWANPGKVPEALAVHGFVSPNGDRYQVLLLSDALKRGLVKEVKPVKWIGDDGLKHSGSGYVLAMWKPGDPQPQYVGVISKHWKHGRVELKARPDKINQGVVAQLDFSNAGLTQKQKSVAHQAAILGEHYLEGKKRQQSGNRYERNPKARRRCIELQGVTCVICGFNFGDHFGPHGDGFIHVHHEISVAGGVRHTNPENDLRPVCPNCHAMLHLRASPMTIADLKKVLRKHCGLSKSSKPRGIR